MLEKQLHELEEYKQYANHTKEVRLLKHRTLVIQIVKVKFQYLVTAKLLFDKFCFSFSCSQFTDLIREKIELDWPDDLDEQHKHCAVLQSEIAVASDRKDELLKVCVST